jgi:hypothetical protein
MLKRELKKSKKEKPLEPESIVSGMTMKGKN